MTPVNKIALYLLFFIILFLGATRIAAAATAEAQGRIVYLESKPSEFWYLDTKKSQRHLVTNYKEVLGVFKYLFVGISEKDFLTLQSLNSVALEKSPLFSKMAGKIMLRVEKRGAAWFASRDDKKIYDLSSENKLFSFLPKLATKISPNDLALFHKPGLKESIDKYSSYEYQKVKTERGIFNVAVVKIDLSDPKLKIISDTADAGNCEKNCQAKPLAEYVFAHQAFAGINGTYFCSGKSCGAANYYFFPVYNTEKKIFVNEDKLKYWTTGPLIAFDQNNKFYYFKDSRDFKSVADFEKNFGVELQAAIGNKPRLIEEGKNALITWEVDPGQLNGKYWRNAIAYQDNNTNGHGLLYLVIAKNATLDDLALIMKTMKMDYALNLDGGSSAALFYNDEYMEGPGRDIPNALLFAK